MKKSSALPSRFLLFFGLFFHLFFDPLTHRLEAFHIQNPDNLQEILKIRFSDWRNIQGLTLPHHLEIEQGDKVFTFDFVRITLNAPDFLEKSPANGQ